MQPSDQALYSQATAKVSNWLKSYFKGLENQPVRSAASPGDIKAQVPLSPPIDGQGFDNIFADFAKLADQGITHWNHPRFFAYFPCSTSAVALAADQLASALSQQGMLWQTSPLSTELEERCIDWMIQMIGLGDQGFSGLINDTASTSTLSAVLMARERATEFAAREKGLAHSAPLRVYVSPEAHSSVNKAVWLAGLGAENCVKIPTRADDKIDLEALKSQIASDRDQDMIPAMIVGTAGGTSIGAFDDLVDLGKIAKAEGLHYHIDAAWAGVAAIAPEYRELFAGWELADSIVMNPHKWLMTGMECSVFLTKSPELLRGTMAIVPSYLETHGQSDFTNYSEYTPQLGRSFRSLKLWFVIRYFGANGLADILRNHVNWSQDLCERLRKHPRITITTEPNLSLFSFALEDDEKTLALVNRINDDGRIYITQSTYRGRTIVRFVAGTASCAKEDVDIAGDVIEEFVDMSTKRDAWSD